MHLSLNWLKDFVNIPSKIKAEDLGRLLSLHTVEVEKIEKQSDKFKNVVVGKILEIKKHPNADRLQLTRVDVGKEVLDIVCGASNIEVGQMVPVALVGAVLPNGIEIKEAEVRGEKSSGMLCALDELGMGSDHSGIMILDKKAKLGQSLGDYLGLKDTVFEVDNKSLSNRPDLWGHYGIARDIAALLDEKVKPIKLSNKVLGRPSGKVNLQVKIDDKKICPRYMAIAMEGIVVAPSPDWMQERLIAAGMRPINNIVDVTNYVMLELGQPLHAFDAELVRKGDDYKMGVREAKAKEKIETLDGESRELSTEDIVITDLDKPIAIAGIMGGANSEIGDKTKNIIIEAANFDYISIRRSSQKLDIRTESSMRFEKGLDPNLCETGILRAVELIKKVSPKSKVASELVDEKNFSLNTGPIEIDLSWLENMVGQKIEKEKVFSILENLGFEAEHKNSEILKIKIPTWRATRDISIKEDLVEEIIRIYGYDNIKAVMPKIDMGGVEVNKEKILERKIRDILSGAPAMSEVYNYSFVGEEQLKKLNIDYSRHIRLLNPIASNQSLLRQNLAPNLINNIVFNQPRFDSIKIFEIGNIYLSSEGSISKDAEKNGFLPYQEKRLGLALASGDMNNSFSKIKGIIEYLFSALDINIYYKESETMPSWADGKYFAEIMFGPENIGYVAGISGSLGRGVGLKKESVISEINLLKIYEIFSAKDVRKYEPLDKFPHLVRDLAFVVESKVLYNDIKKEIMNFDKLIKRVELFDVFQGGKLGEGKKSMAFHIVYQAERTLVSEEVDGLQKKLIKNLEQKFGAKIRDF